MEFASKFAYLRKNEAEDEEEEDAVVAEEDLAGQLQSHVKPAPRSALSAAPRPPAPRVAREKRKQAVRREVDTNVVAIPFANLAKDADSFFAGDPVYCSECKACLTATSTVLKPGEEGKAPEEKKAEESKVTPIKLEQGQMLWPCEFCGHRNVIEIDEQELPKTETRDYVLEGAGDAKQDKVRPGEGQVIFCVDVSGSMGQTSTVPGTFKLKGKRNVSAFDVPLGRNERAAPVQQVQETYVSRLQCVQAWLDSQMEAWAKDMADKRVGLITFNHEVQIHGDGTAPVESVVGDKLHNQQLLTSIGDKHALQRGVGQALPELSKRLWDLEEDGQTALGPALVIALQMASKQPGSTVVLCTDGVATRGIGALDEKDEEKKQEAQQWYETMGEYAKAHGVVVSVISIKGQECRLEDIGRCAELTGGSIERVDPLELTKNFASILANPVIATQVTATMFLHRGLKFRNEPEDSNKLTREIGNVTVDSEASFEYQMKDKAVLDKFKALKALPFQVQIHFTKLDGMKCLRVVSRSQEITHDRVVAEQHASIDLLAANAMKKAAKHAEQGDYMQARAENVVWARMMGRASRSPAQQAVYQNWASEATVWDQDLQQQHSAISAVSMAPPPPAAPLGGAAAPERGGILSSLRKKVDQMKNVFSSDERNRPSMAPGSEASPQLQSHVARSMRTDAQYHGISKMKAKSSAAFRTPASLSPALPQPSQPATPFGTPATPAPNAAPQAPASPAAPAAPANEAKQ